MRFADSGRKACAAGALLFAAAPSGELPASSNDAAAALTGSQRDGDSCACTPKFSVFFLSVPEFLLTFARRDSARGAAMECGKI